MRARRSRADWYPAGIHLVPLATDKCKKESPRQLLPTQPVRKEAGEKVSPFRWDTPAASIHPLFVSS